MTKQLRVPKVLNYMLQNGAENEYTAREISEGIGDNYLNTRQTISDLKHKNQYIIMTRKKGYEGYYKLRTSLLPQIKAKIRKGGINPDE